MKYSNIIYNVLAFVFIIKSLIMVYLNIKLKENKK